MALTITLYFLKLTTTKLYEWLMNVCERPVVPVYGFLLREHADRLLNDQVSQSNIDINILWACLLSA